jgi:hypothetical protein
MSSATHLKIKNLKTEQVYTVTQEGWDMIVAKKMASKYEIVEELRPQAERISRIPDAIAKAAADAVAGEVIEEQPKPAKGTK